MTTDPLNLRADTGETFTRKTLIVGILFQYWNEFISYRIYTTKNNWIGQTMINKPRVKIHKAVYEIALTVTAELV